MFDLCVFEKSGNRNRVVTIYYQAVGKIRNPSNNLIMNLIYLNSNGAKSEM